MPRQVLFEVSVGKSVLAERQADLVEGPFAEIHWGRLLSIAELHAKIVGKYFELNADDFEFRHALRENGNCFSPCVRVYLFSGQQLPIDVVRQLLFSTACAIISEEISQDSLFPMSELKEPLPSAPISEFLSKCGGKRVIDDMVVTFQNEVIAQVSGTFASRPADEVIRPEARRVSAIVDDVCASGRSAVCRVVENGTKGNKLTISFSEVFLQPLASALGRQGLARIVYEETLDAKGQRFLNLLQVAAEDESDFHLAPLM